MTLRPHVSCRWSHQWKTTAAGENVKSQQPVKYHSVKLCWEQLYIFPALVPKLSIGTLIKNFYFLYWSAKRCTTAAGPVVCQKEVDGEGRVWERRSEWEDVDTVWWMITKNTNTQEDTSHMRWGSCQSCWERGLSLFVRLKHCVKRGMWIISHFSPRLFKVKLCI